MMLAFLFACRGQTMETPPVHVVWNMDEQKRFEAYERNEFFSDNRAMRQPVEGTVHRGGLQQDEAYYQGINEDSTFITDIPIAINREFLLRGQDQFNVFCTPCHGITGDGQGVIIAGDYGFVPPPSFHSERLRNMPAGQIYSTIANGIRTMFPYADQIAVEDRWAVVAYIRALQSSQRVSGQELNRYDASAEELDEIYANRSDTTEPQQRTPGGAVSVDRGETLIAAFGCTTCHTTDGANLFAPSFKGLYGSQRVLSDHSIVIADKGYLIESMQYPAAKIVLGWRAEMPSYRDLMSDSEMQSVVEYLKTIQ